MSDSKDSTVTYMEVSSLFEDLSDIGSPRVNGLPMMPQDPYAYVEAALQAQPSPNYVPGPEHPPTPEFVLKPIYPEFMPPEDEVFLAEDQPLPIVVSPTTDSLGYIADSDLKEDDDDLEEDPEEDPTDYPADGGYNDEDDDESSDDDKDDNDDVEEDEDEDKEEEEHPALAASVPPLVYHVTVIMSIRDQPPTPFGLRQRFPDFLPYLLHHHHHYNTPIFNI
nr:hypothetical protein [Tanacetum cinerariifolium]